MSAEWRYLLHGTFDLCNEDGDRIIGMSEVVLLRI